MYLHSHRAVPTCTENNKSQLRIDRPKKRNVDNICCNNSYLFLLLFGGEGDLQVKIMISY